jgi:hypothetical protein
MGRDFIPTGDSDLSEWLVALKKSITDTGASVGLGPSEISDSVALCNEYIAQIQDTHTKRVEARASVTKKKAMIKTHQPKLRHVITKMKVLMNKQNAKAYKLMSQKRELEEAGFKPKLNLLVTGGYIVAKFKKRGVAGMQFRVKINNNYADGEWINLGLRNHSPLKYKPEGYPPGTVLRVWISALAIIKDKPFGDWSDGASVLFVVG